LSSSAIGVLTLAAASWAPIFLLGAITSITSASIGPLAVLVIFGLPVSLALAVAGFLVILILLGTGRALVWAMGHRRGAAVNE
jgi:hypothetical protein